jgi:hypothetical protein
MTIATASRAPVAAFDARALIGADLFDTYARRVARVHNLTPARGVRVMVNAVAFMRAAGENPGAHLAPPLEVDWGWHEMILDTRVYPDVCARVAGRFLHHRPADGLEDGGAAIQRTAALMRASGLPADTDLYDPRGSGCHNACHNDDGPAVA